MAQKPSSKLKMIEGFISEHFDLRYNTISNMVEYKGKAERDFSPLNESNIYRMMHLNDIKVSLQQISILLNSDFVPNRECRFKKLINLNISILLKVIVVV